MRCSAAILLTVACHCAAAEFHYTNDGFSITLPARWIELPPETIRELREKPADELPFPLEGVVHIYQTDDAAQPVSLPLVYVQVLKTGRIPDFFVWQLVRTNDPNAMIRQFLREQ